MLIFFVSCAVISYILLCDGNKRRRIFTDDQLIEYNEFESMQEQHSDDEEIYSI
jgi:hypothetical protein